MPRPPRFSQPGTVVHVASRGANGATIFRDDDDRNRFLTQYISVASRYDWRLLGYCLMSNHYHLLIEPLKATLSKGMQRLNGQYASIFNDRHARPGCVFQARFWSAPVDNERYLHAVVRYIALNPVKAHLCAAPEDWHWGGHRELAGLDRRALVDVERTLGLLASHETPGHGPYLALFEPPDDPLADLTIRSGAELAWDEVQRETVRLARSGFSVQQLAQAVRRDTRTVRRWLASAG
jgi:putative transposase